MSKKDEAKDKGGEVFTVEEIKKTLNISAPVFAAVMQANGWAAGKKVSVAVFEQAAKGFLNGPMGGKK
jgi:glycine cleavage system H lipoate-binding protein